jgi:hypothetical protein
MQMQGVDQVYTKRVPRGADYKQMETVKGGMVDVVKGIFKNGGVRGLYRGFLPNCMKVIPATSISYAMYGYLEQMVKGRNAD